jgi:tRNA/rRNA methyltransferase
MARLRIVLVEPREAGNVGAVARVMKNFGFAELWIVGQHPTLLPVSGWWASGADDVLATAHFVPTLEEAIGDAHLTVATTSMRGRTTATSFDPRTLGAYVTTMEAAQLVAIVFGREDSGLTRDEVVLCQHTASIPTNAAFPTMNLAQSVCVFSYELSSIVPVPAGRVLPTADLLERLHQRAQQLLLDTGFLRPGYPARLYDELRNLLARADVDEREVTILLGIIRQVEWALRRSDSSDARG